MFPIPAQPDFDAARVQYIPWFSGGKLISVSGTLYAPILFGDMDEAGNIFRVVEAHPRQGRGDMFLDPILSAIAQERAEDMAQRFYFSHTTPEGVGPNDFTRSRGYPVPDWYGRGEANNIESLGLNYMTAEEVAQAWFDSPAHRAHVYGTDPFFRGQTRIGTGYACRFPGFHCVSVFLSVHP